MKLSAGGGGCCTHGLLCVADVHVDDTLLIGSYSLTSASAELRDFEPDDHQEIEVDEGNTAVIECHLPESQPKAQVRYSVKQEWLETSKGTPLPPLPPLCLCFPLQSNPIVP